MKISEITRESFFTWNGEGRDTTRLYDAAYKLLIDTAKKKGYLYLEDFEGQSYTIFGNNITRSMEYVIDFLEKNGVRLKNADSVRNKNNYQRNYHRKRNQRIKTEQHDVIQQACELLKETEKMKKNYSEKIKDMINQITSEIEKLGKEKKIEEKDFVIELIQQGELKEAKRILDLIQTKQELEKEGERLL